MIERVFSAQATGVSDPADTARSYAGEFPDNAMFPLKDFFFCREQANKFLTDVAESDESQVVGANKNSSRAVYAC
jgi:hypothetical protein